MSKYDFAIRFRPMLNKECSVTSMEAGIAKKSAKYYEDSYELKRILEEQVKEFEMISKEVEKLKSHNQKLEKSVQENEQRLATITKNIQEFEKEYEIEMQLRKAAQMKMALLHNIKETTQTCINMKALPNRLEGAKHIEKGCSGEWKPFVKDVKEWINLIDEQFANIKKPEPSTEAQNMTSIV